MDRTDDALFPRHPVCVEVNSAEEVEDSPFLTVKEVEEAILTMKNKKAPGPDVIPPKEYY